MAESAQRLSEPLKARKPEGEWSKVAGFRNVLAHDYLDIDLELIWNIIEIDLPNLKGIVTELQKELEGV